MSIKTPFTAVEVRRAASGFYEGHSVEIVLLSKGIMVALVIWALVWPANANSNLSSQKKGKKPHNDDIKCVADLQKPPAQAA